MLPKLLPALRSALVCAVLLIAAPCVAQTTINVGPGQPYTTIQSGIDAAVDGDKVLVAPGTYYENIDFKGKAIVVSNFGESYQTIIDGSRGLNPTVVFRNNEGVHSQLIGFTIQGGGYSAATPPAGNYGNGGVSIQNASPVIAANVITHNYCNGIQSNRSSPQIVGNEIDNTLDPDALCGEAGGSAIWLFGSLNYYNSGPFSISLAAYVSQNLIQNNTQSGRDNAVHNGGAGLAIWGAFADITHNTIRNNQTLGDGGAILAFDTSIVYLSGNLIYGNQAGTDGAISLQPTGDSVGSILGLLEANTIYGNTQTESTGGAYNDVPPSEVYLTGNLAQYLLINNIIVGAGSGSVAVSCGANSDPVTPLIFDHNDIYNPGGNGYGAYCTNQDGTSGNIAVDPQFSNPANDDFTLRSGSPAIDSGNNSANLMLLTDIANSPRIQDGTGKGYPIVDMGAYEFAGSQDAAPTILQFAPSEYFDSIDEVPPAPLIFTLVLSSAAGTPSGPVTIFVDGVSTTVIPVGAGGAATFTLPTLTPGLHAFTATYPGSGIYPPAVSVKFFLLIPGLPTNLQLTSAPNPSFFGSAVTFTVAASAADSFIPSPVSLTDTTTNTLLATLTPNAAGTATYSTSALAVGDHTIAAAYAGDANHASSSATVVQDVLSGPSTTTSLTCSPSTISVFNTAALSASVTSANGTPTGSIAFTDNGAALVTQVLQSGSTSLTYTGLIAGSHTLSATYVPIGAFSPSSASCSEVVTLLPTTSVLRVTPATPTKGAPVTLTATVSPSTPPGPSTPAGSVTFYNGAKALGVGTIANGVATLSLTTLPSGSDNLTCAYSGSSLYAASNCNTVPVTINVPTSTSLTVSPNPAYVGQQVTMAATVSPQTSSTQVLSGSVAFFDGATALATQQISGTGPAAFTTSSLTVGTHQITATFAPSNTVFASSTSALVNEVILASGFTIALSPATITLAPGASGTAAIQVASVGNFAGPLALTYGTLPTYTTAAMSATSVTLTAGGTGSSTLTLNTLLKSASTSSPRPGSTSLPVAFATLMLALIPFSRARRKRVTGLLSFVLLALALPSFTGCTNAWYTANSVAPGSYQIPIIATDVNRSSQTATLTLVITQ